MADEVKDKKREDFRGLWAESKGESRAVKVMLAAYIIDRFRPTSAGWQEELTQEELSEMESFCSELNLWIEGGTK